LPELVLEWRKWDLPPGGGWLVRQAAVVGGQPRWQQCKPLGEHAAELQGLQGLRAEMAELPARTF
jgi:hypothetical protein